MPVYEYVCEDHGLFEAIRPHLLRYPALDPDAFAARVAQWA